MPHYFEAGFSVREVPWHGLGKILDGYPGSWTEAQQLAGMDWEPVKRPAYDIVGEIGDDGRAQVTLIEDFQQVVRSDTGGRLGMCSGTYELISHAEMGEIFESVMTAADGQIEYETGGVLDGGKRVWALARVGAEREIPGDPSPMQPYIAVLNSHDGSAALKVINTNVRIVCANTWHAADMDAERRGSSYSFKHTRNWKSRVEEAKRALATTHELIDHSIEEARRLLTIKLTQKQERQFIEQYAIHRTIKNTVGKKGFGRQELAARLDNPRVQKSMETTIADLNRIINSRTCDGIRGTAWGVVQAAGELADHFRETRTSESYFSRTVLAEREPLKLGAVRIAQEVAFA